jgi:hypothetical protein
MTIQKLMAVRADMLLQQSEEIIRLRRNVSSLAKKNHELTRQVHELVLRLQQYPPLRIPEERAQHTKLKASVIPHPPPPLPPPIPKTTEATIAGIAIMALKKP